MVEVQENELWTGHRQPWTIIRNYEYSIWITDWIAANLIPLFFTSYLVCKEQGGVEVGNFP
jgi:hypothetical protein